MQMRMLIERRYRGLGLAMKPVIPYVGCLLAVVAHHAPLWEEIWG
jgi:hypothetical protein